MMNQQKSAKAGILKYSFIIPLALALVLSSNVQTLVASAESTISQNNEVRQAPKKVINQQNSSSKNSKAQTGKVTNEKPYNLVQNMPQFPGGDMALLNFINKSLKYPIDAQNKGIQGKVILRFVVNSDGKVGQVEILRGLSPSTDKEAIRVVNSFPKWTPGVQNGKSVSTYYVLPITFRLS